MLLGIAIGVFGLFFMHIELTKWWQHNIGKAHSYAGFVVGFGAIVHTLLFGLLTEYLGVVTTVLCVSALHAAIFVAVGADGLALRYKVEEVEGSVSEKGGGPAPARGEPIGSLQLLCNWRMQLLMAMFVFMMFCGMAFKMLLSTLFEQALQKTHLESTFFSALCLTFYWACR